MSYNPFAWPFRAQYLAGFVFCAALLAYAFYEQFQMGVEPCPMCIFQRLAFMGMGIFFLIGGLHSPGARGRRVYAMEISPAYVAVTLERWAGATGGKPVLEEQAS